MASSIELTDPLVRTTSVVPDVQESSAEHANLLIDLCNIRSVLARCNLTPDARAHCTCKACVDPLFARRTRGVCIVDDEAAAESTRLGPSVYRGAGRRGVPQHPGPARPARTNGASAGGSAVPTFRLTRSVDQGARKNEATLHSRS